MLEDGPLLLSREAAELLGVTPRTLRAWVASGAIDAYRLPGGYRFRAGEVLRAMRRRGIPNAEAKLRYYLLKRALRSA